MRSVTTTDGATLPGGRTVAATPKLGVYTP